MKPQTSYGTSWKLEIIGNKSNCLLNKRIENNEKCWHQNKFKLPNFEIGKQNNRIIWNSYLLIGNDTVTFGHILNSSFQQQRMKRCLLSYYSWIILECCIKKKQKTNKKTKAELKLLTDINIMQDIEVDIKSWISII